MAEDTFRILEFGNIYKNTHGTLVLTGFTTAGAGRHLTFEANLREALVEALRLEPVTLLDFTAGAAPAPKLREERMAAMGELREDEQVAGRCSEFGGEFNVEA
jgi:hypothetical protein